MAIRKREEVLMKKLLSVFLFLMVSFMVTFANAEYLVKEDTDDNFYIVLVDSTDFITAETGKTAADTTVQYSTGTGAGWSTYDDTSMFWEIGNGVYSITMGASEFTENLRYIVRTAVTGAADYIFDVNVLDNSSNEVVVNINDIETDTNEIQGKLPTNYLMGSSVVGDMDGHIIGISTTAANTNDYAIKNSTTTNNINEAVTNGTYGLSALEALVDDLEGRLSAARAAYLDHIPAISTTTYHTDQNSVQISTWTVARANKLDYLDAAISGRSSHSAADVWAVGTREPTGGTIDTVNNDVNISDTDQNYIADRATGAIVSQHGAGSYETATGFSTHGAADVWNLDISGYSGAKAGTYLKWLYDEWTAARFGYIDSIVAISTDTTNIASIKTVTDKFGFDGSNNVNSTPQTNVTVGTNSDKTGYALSADGITAIFNKDISALNEPSAGGYIVTGSTGPTVSASISDEDKNYIIDGTTNAVTNQHGSGSYQTATGFSTHAASDVASLILLTPANKLATDGSGYVTVATVNDKTGYSLATASYNTLVDLIWDELIAGHLDVGSTGAKLNSAAAAGDPWETALPGSYTGSQAGKIIDNIRKYTNGTKDDSVWNGIENMIRRHR